LKDYATNNRTWVPDSPQRTQEFLAKLPAGWGAAAHYFDWDISGGSQPALSAKNRLPGMSKVSFGILLIRLQIAGLNRQRTFVLKKASEGECPLIRRTPDQKRPANEGDFPYRTAFGAAKACFASKLGQEHQLQEPL
jgi:hypothetical protein